MWSLSKVVPIQSEATCSEISLGGGGGGGIRRPGGHLQPPAEICMVDFASGEGAWICYLCIILKKLVLCIFVLK